MLVSELDYELPKELIAQHPAPERDGSRLMVLGRRTGEISHRVFRDLPELLGSGDLLVLNDTRVFPGRLFGHRRTGGKAEALMLGPGPKGSLRTLLRTRGKVKPGEVFSFASDKIRIRVTEKDETGAWYFAPLIEGFKEKLKALGDVPLPPYIQRDYSSGEYHDEDLQRYQTVFARETNSEPAGAPGGPAASLEGSAAAPTAGLHFTPALLESLAGAGIETCFVTLNIGYETFRPVKEEKVEEHAMHSEFYHAGAETLAAIRAAKRQGRRIVAAGTTSCRVLETLARVTALQDECPDRDHDGWTGIFIYPGFEFKLVEALITNFHLPRSTLLMLVCAFAGKEKILASYREAVHQKYCFYSYGDAMLIT